MELVAADGLVDSIEALPWTVRYDRKDPNLVDGDNVQARTGLDSVIEAWPDGAHQEVTLKIVSGNDTVRPAGTVKINGGAASTNAGFMTLDLDFVDNDTGLHQVRYRKGANYPWSDWQAYSDVITGFDNRGNDGTRWAIVQVSDRAGNVTTAWDSILLDREKPIGTVAINGGDEHTNSGFMTLNLSFADCGSGLEQVRYRKGNNFPWSSWETYSATINAFDNRGADGTRWAIVQVRDAAGNVTTAYDSIVLDRTRPTGVVEINGGDGATNSGFMTLNLDFSDEGSGVDKVRFRKGSSSPWSEWQSYNDVITDFDNRGNDGTRWAIVQVSDHAGNVATVWDSILLDRKRPSGNVVINGGDPVTNSGFMTLNLDFADGGSGLFQVRYRKGNNFPWSSWQPYTDVIAGFDNRGLDGTRWAIVQVSDYAGNVTTAWDSIVLQRP